MKALAKLYSRLLAREINAMTEVLITGGAYPSLFCAIMSNVGKGDEVRLTKLILRHYILNFAEFD